MLLGMDQSEWRGRNLNREDRNLGREGKETEEGMREEDKQGGRGDREGEIEREIGRE